MNTSSPDPSPDLGTAPGARAVALIRAALGTLVASERRVAEVVLADPRAVIGSTASQLGSRADTSATTVIRFARNVGFGGYQELAIALAVAEPSLDTVPALSPTDSPAETLRGVAALAQHAVGSIADSVDPEAFAAAIRAFSGARHTIAVGAALTGPVAEDLAFRLTHLGHPADAPTDAQIQWIRAQQLGPGDVCVAILHGGTYPHVVEVAREAKAAGASVIAITSFARTPLAELADIALVVGGTTARSGMDAWGSRLAYLATIDALLIALTNTDPAGYRARLERIGDRIERDLL
ncbi:MurR/RpiR family transcriptional regulator [Mycetocola sp. JXN-3]|uniref:MurR/RpiR family transcriptional regulator n=1 Tax=Mycetocola sp. JXN-3 TaxID=2116510 RepID=UPI00165D21F7|nr:MurR/RpiR family transcriptional regulator [Mycetocola sp. JXN-3]